MRLIIVTILVFLLSAATPVWAEKRVALVIGNSDYVDEGLGDLRNPGNDARDIAAALRRQGFELVGGEAQLDLGRFEMLTRILEFGDRLGPDVVGLFYYAGHGVSVDKTNYLVPVDVSARSKREVPLKMVAADHIMSQFAETGGGLNIMILDACRNTPAVYRGIRSGGGEGLSEMRAASGTLISYATQPGNVALDGSGRNSPFAEALLRAIATPDVGIWSAFNTVSLDVRNATGGGQVPWTTSVALEGDFYFAGRREAPSAGETTTSTADTVFWQSIQRNPTIGAYEAYLSTFPNGIYRDLARARLAELRQAAALPGVLEDEAVVLDVEEPSTPDPQGVAALPGEVSSSSTYDRNSVIPFAGPDIGSRATFLLKRKNGDELTHTKVHKGVDGYLILYIIGDEEWKAFQGCAYCYSESGGTNATQSDYGELWPLTIGKSVHFYRKKGLQSWSVKITVDRFERVDLPGIGAIPTFVLEYESFSSDGRWHVTATYNYSPDLRINVRIQSTDNRNADRNWTMTLIDYDGA